MKKINLKLLKRFIKKNQSKFHNTVENNISEPPIANSQKQI